MILTDEAAARHWLEQLREYDQDARARIDHMVALLADENARQNLVSSTSLNEVWRRHVADSAQLLRFVSRETGLTWLDLGSGAGFPGLVIAALWPDCAMTLVESRPRRAEWLERARIAMDLPQVKVEAKSLEQIDSASFQVISARAFAPLPKLLDLSARFSTATTFWLLPKGRSAPQELEGLAGWQHMFHVEQSLTDPEAGIIVGTLTGKKGENP